MLRSMYAAISGLKNFQTKLDVIGNNISNVNTFGFKKSRVNFQDLINQEISGASAPTFNKGGINPVQVGLGSTVGSIDNIDTQGNLQTTGRSLDLAISGDGYFMVRDGFNNYYTRAGNLYLDAQGNLVNSGGQRVLGYGVDQNGAISTQKLTPLSINKGDVLQPETTSLSFTGNIDDADKMMTTPSGSSTPVGVTNYTSKPVSFKVFDKNHNSYNGTLTFGQTTGQPTPTITKDPTTGNYYVSKIGFTMKIDNNGTPETQTGTIDLNPSGAETAMTLDPSSYYSSATNTLSFPVGTGGNSINIKSSDLDFSTLTARSKVPEDARAVGDVADINSFSIGSDGQITAVLSNGTTQTLGQLALAKFNNPGGLQKDGSSLYSSTSNSGQPQIGSPGANGSGTLQAGALEMSNVDLAEEFTGMIEAQRGFQANAKVITTADQILQTLVNLKQ